MANTPEPFIPRSLRTLQTLGAIILGLGLMQLFGALTLSLRSIGFTATLKQSAAWRHARTACGCR